MVRPLQRTHQRAVLTQPIQLRHVGQPLGGEPRRGALEYGAHFNRIEDFGDREPAHGEAAGRDDVEKADVREPLQRQTDRRPRHAEPRDHRQFRDALAAPELAAHQQLAHADERARDLRGDVSVSARLVAGHEHRRFRHRAGSYSRSALRPMAITRPRGARVNRATARTRTAARTRRFRQRPRTCRRATGSRVRSARPGSVSTARSSE